MPIVRLGKQKYKVNKDWINQPGLKGFNILSAISVDQNDNIYVLQREDPYILVFSNEGKLIDEWYNKDINDGHFLKVLSDGNVCIVDRDQHRIIVLDSHGKIIKEIGSDKQPGLYGDPFNHPTDVVISKTGDMFVADGYGNARIHHFDSNGKLIKSWGEYGRGKSEFIVPHAIVIDKEDRILVADRENHRIQIFNQDGNYLSEINNIHHPMGLYVDDSNYIYVTDRTPGLSVYNSKSELIGRCRTFGTDPHSITMDSRGNIYIAEMHIDSVTKFTRLSEN